jgi:pSer/pThr/pTyr-binding forkhead associated (FHA) protein
MPRCSNCGKVNRDGSLFCQDCGTSLVEGAPGQIVAPGSGSMPGLAGAAPGTVTCPACGAANQLGQNYCKQCGGALAKAPTPPRPGAPAPIGPLSAVASVPFPAGAPMPRVITTCAHCGGETPPGMPFCQHCGQKLPGAPSSPPSRSPSAAVAATLAAPGGQPMPPAPGAKPTPPAGLRVGSGLTGHQPHGGAAFAPTMMPTSGQIDQILAGMPVRSAGAGPAASPPEAAPPPLAPDAPAPSSPLPGLAAAAAPSAPAQSPPSSALGGDEHEDGRPTTSQPAQPAPDAVRASATLVEEPEPTGRLVLVQSDGSDGTVYPLAGDQIDMGRTDGALTFPEDRFLAMRHARLERRGDRWVVAPLESRNGVFVRLREPVDLGEVDIFLVGKQVFRFEQVPDIERDPGAAIEHGVHLFGTPAKQPWGRLLQVTTSGVARDVFYLTRAEIVLGREEGDFIFPDDEFMSRRHVAISESRGRARMDDLGSSNGTYLRIRGERELRPGDMIRLGDQLLRYEALT